MLKLFQRRRKTPEAAAKSRNTAGAVSRGLRMPKGQVSARDDTNLGNLLAFLEDKLAGYPKDNRSRIIKVFRMLAQSDDDLGGTIRDLTALAITPFTWELDGTDAAQAQAEAALEEWRASVFPTGLNGLAQHQAREAYITGATSLEWVPKPDGQGIERAESVPTESIRMKRDPDTGAWAHYQLAGSKLIELDARTYKYGALELDGASPYGVPAPITALNALARKGDLLRGEDRLITSAAAMALVTAAVKPPSAQELGCTGPNDPAYPEKLQEYMTQIADLLSSGSERGLYVHPDTVTLSTTNLNQNLQGSTELSESNQRLLWSGLGTQPFMRGDMSANYALAKVIYPTMLAFAEKLRVAVITNLEFGMNLHLRLLGIPVQAWLAFEDPPNPFIKDDAEAEKAKADTDKIMYDLIGDAWLPKLSARWDITEADLDEAAGTRRNYDPPPPESREKEGDADDDA